MSSHDEELLKDAKGPKKAFDMNGNFNYEWRGVTTTFTHFENVYEIFVYTDNTKQISYYLIDEPILSTW